MSISLNIVNIVFIYNNNQAANTCVVFVYISQLIRHSRACGFYYFDSGFLRYIKDTTGTSMHASNLDICLKFTVRDDEEGLLIA
jgi:hypothetical protein